MVTFFGDRLPGIYIIFIQRVLLNYITKKALSYSVYVCNILYGGKLNVVKINSHNKTITEWKIYLMITLKTYMACHQNIQCA